jgi:hypothetical protein
VSEWEVAVAADTITGAVVLKMTEEQAISLRDSLMWLLDGEAS